MRVLTEKWDSNDMDHLFIDDCRPHKIVLHATRSLTMYTDQELVDALAKNPFITQFDSKRKKTIYQVNRWQFRFKDYNIYTLLFVV